MNISIEGFHSKVSAHTHSSHSASSNDLYHFIAEYESTQSEIVGVGQKSSEQQQQLNQDQLLYATVKNEKLPIRMFKDRMDLLKQNREKKNIVSNLQTKNSQLKQEYDTCLLNNQKIEQFLKQIQFTFKNDSLNQRASDILLRAKKNLHRQQKDSENKIDRLMKKSKVNEIRQLKMYLKILREQKARLEENYAGELKQNEILRRMEDLNENERSEFQSCQGLVTEILNDALMRVKNIRQTDKQQKLIIGTKINRKKIEDLKENNERISERIKEELLKQQGLEYEIDILKSKLQQKNKRHAKEQEEKLKKQIFSKKRRLTTLRQQLREKMKTQEYITKWTKQLKIKLEELKEDHFKVKQKFEEQINKLSREIEEWNRKYKAELVEEQFIHRKSVPKQSEKIAENSTQERKIRVVKISEIEHLRKKLMFLALRLKINVPDFIKVNILFRKEGHITLKQIFQRLKRLKNMQEESSEEIFKMARYIIEDNGSDFSKIDMNQKISVSLAFIILKNFLNGSLTVQNFEQTQIELVTYLNNNFDLVKNQIWLNSGKTKNFTADTLKVALSKYIKEEKVCRFVEMIEFLIWKHFKSTLFFELLQFEMVCEKILGRKLVKDGKKRISKMTVKSAFDSLYEKKQDEVKQISH